MKRIVITLLAFVLFVFTTSAIASSCPLPNVNTDAEIIFSGFEWYADYSTTLQTATEKGITNQFDWSRDNFKDDGCLTPHWYTIYNSINSFAGSEERCGGYLNYISDIPNVAGYKIDSLKLYMMWNPDNGIVADYTQPDAVQFYMAKYEFDVSNTEDCYNDLVSKLKTLYGENPITDVYGPISPTTYTCWVNADKALIGVSYDKYGVNLVYMAPGAEERLLAVEDKVRQQEIEGAQNDMTGL
ncbi:MAG: hypothetical protein IJH86_01390 [Clostridia bacterium]|nr:hypothetical protein [Clostridia bacterium]